MPTISLRARHRKARARIARRDGPSSSTPPSCRRHWGPRPPSHGEWRWRGRGNDRLLVEQEERIPRVDEIQPRLVRDLPGTIEPSAGVPWRRGRPRAQRLERRAHAGDVLADTVRRASCRSRSPRWTSASSSETIAHRNDGARLDEERGAARARRVNGRGSARGRRSGRGRRSDPHDR